MKITEKLLKRYKACSDGIDWFNKKYPKGIDIPKGTKEFTIQDYDVNVEWFLGLKLIKDMTLKIGNSNGSWSTRDYNEQGLLVRYDNSRGYWTTKEYNEQGLLVRSEKSNATIINY